MSVLSFRSFYCYFLHVKQNVFLTAFPPVSFTSTLFRLEMKYSQYLCHTFKDIKLENDLYLCIQLADSNLKVKTSKITSEQTMTPRG